MAINKLEIELKTKIYKHQIIDWIFRNTIGDVYFDIDEWCELDADILAKASELIKSQIQAKKSK